ncbi:MAG TPA: EF-hand domain-containing protein, partial [Desulfobaccales bacterium]|nr:EF-hand domain-containing protein [Desulfobaccales bacterium]
MKRYLLGSLFLAMFAALVMGGCASTQEQAMSPQDRALCSALDTNRDGRITKEEFMARTNDKNKALEVFQNCDTGNK